jgi:hypothetical protein
MYMSVDPASLNHSANTLMELAGLLQAGRPELRVTARANEPNTHHEIGLATRNFTEFAHDQYQDAVALLAALSMRLSKVAEGYQEMDHYITAQMMDQYLSTSRYQPGES